MGPIPGTSPTLSTDVKGDNDQAVKEAERLEKELADLRKNIHASLSLEVNTLGDVPKALANEWLVRLGLPTVPARQQYTQVDPEPGTEAPANNTQSDTVTPVPDPSRRAAIARLRLEALRREAMEIAIEVSDGRNFCKEGINAVLRRAGLPPLPGMPVAVPLITKAQVDPAEVLLLEQGTDSSIEEMS